MGLQAELLQAGTSALLGNYRPAPIVLTRGAGRTVWDVEGRAYLDLSGGIAVTSVGHGHPRLAQAIAEQAARLMHTSNLFWNDRAIELATEIVRRTGFDRVFFCNSGTEANEAMLKLARRYHFERGDRERVELVGALGSFHGRTYGSLSLTGQTRHRIGMEPLLGGCHLVPFGDIEALRSVVGPRTAAVLLEPIQAEGGIVRPPPGYLRAVRRLCDERGALLLLDEVQTGYGRTGCFLAREHEEVWPDACSLAKGIAGGFPLGAMCVTARVRDGLPYGSHASTFGGNPLAAAAGLATLRIFDDEGLVENAARMGARLLDGLRSMERDGSLEAAIEARGLGLLAGMRLAPDVDPQGVVAAMRERGVLVSLAGSDVIRITPALNVTADEIDRGLETLAAVLRDPPRRAAS
ncbi:MAG: acetylornithine/succinylornithine family transaminase [Myxococcota bacterium]|nr:acetylornithine/succinylornithine family transaminase [Myxococcota bacterium]MDW8361236.1 acetylornithine/succinylornithine family transaminase [Myxococcales bacterium]